ncbi:acyl-CoA dehydrogenase [Rathayibacter tritici]|uniref:acyl-CoA dehydrogenase family protein n=1 Tax=Rathayibacter tritici TaxID=33888 RepID=UPI000CE7D5A7|nr:acyl-CoA dehydrogenase family protein [Rathayibacter tritici]PPF66085.1 acyl-CoA dehydrogenase [Rathayibacter tritici]PPG06654.1 acyl-CoA dehydrogenase [Rathayibacter tritici]
MTTVTDGSPARAVEDSLDRAFAAHHSRPADETEFDREGWHRLRSTGILGAPFDREAGGLGLGYLGSLAALERLGTVNHDAGLSFAAITTMASTAVALSRFGSAEQRADLLPRVVAGDLLAAHAITETESGSDALQMSTRAKRDGDHFVLDGTKTFVTNGGIADIYVVYARTSDTPGPLGITAFLVPVGTPGFEIGRRLPTMGLLGSPLAELTFTSCRIPASSVVGRVGGGFLILDHVMEREILFSFTVNVGEMQRRLDRVVAWCRDRRQYGSPIGTYQAVSHKVVDMRIAVDTARMWLHAAAEKLDAGVSAATEISIAKLVTSRGNLQSSLDAIQIFGGRGFLTEQGIERDLRDSVAGPIYSGTNEIQYNRIAAMIGLR